MNGFNPMMLLNMMRGKNPKDVAINMIKSNMPNNPIINNMVNLANNGDVDGVKNVARNILKDRGMDFDKEFTSFLGNFKQ